MTALDAAEAAISEARAQVQAARIATAQARDELLTPAEFVVYLDGLSEREAAS